MKKTTSEFVLTLDETGDPLLSLKTATVSEFRAAKAVDEASQGQNLYLAGAALRALTQAGAGVATKGTYRVVADPKFGRELLVRAKGPERAFRSIYRENGKIVRQAKFKPTNAASMANFAVALLEVATVVTSTVHLQDIAKQLKDINTLARKLHDLLEDQRVGRLKGSLEYLYEVWALRDQGLQFPGDTDRYLPQLEAIYRECLGEVHTARQQLERRKQEINKAQKIRVSGVWVLKKVSAQDTERLREAVTEFSSSLQIALLAQETAAVVCELGAQLGLPAPQTTHRLASLSGHVRQLKQDWGEYENVLRTKFEDVSARPEAQKIQKELAGLVSQHRERPGALAQTLEKIQQRLSDTEPMVLVIKVEDGQVADVRRVLEAPA